MGITGRTAVSGQRRPVVRRRSHHHCSFPDITKARADGGCKNGTVGHTHTLGVDLELVNRPCHQGLRGSAQTVGRRADIRHPRPLPSPASRLRDPSRTVPRDDPLGDDQYTRPPTGRTQGPIPANHPPKTGRRSLNLYRILSGRQESRVDVRAQQARDQVVEADAVSAGARLGARPTPGTSKTGRERRSSSSGRRSRARSGAGPPAASPGIPHPRSVPRRGRTAAGSWSTRRPGRLGGRGSRPCSANQAGPGSLRVRAGKSSSPGGSSFAGGGPGRAAGDGDVFSHMKDRHDRDRVSAERPGTRFNASCGDSTA